MHIDAPHTGIQYWRVSSGSRSRSGSDRGITCKRWVIFESHSYSQFWNEGLQIWNAPSLLKGIRHKLRFLRRDLLLIRNGLAKVGPLRNSWSVQIMLHRDMFFIGNWCKLMYEYSDLANGLYLMIQKDFFSTNQIAESYNWARMTDNDIVTVDNLQKVT